MGRAPTAWHPPRHGARVFWVLGAPVLTKLCDSHDTMGAGVGTQSTASTGELQSHDPPHENPAGDRRRGRGSDRRAADLKRRHDQDGDRHDRLPDFHDDPDLEQQDHRWPDRQPDLQEGQPRRGRHHDHVGAAGQQQRLLQQPSQTTESEGAGVVFNKQGDILTDEHVVAGAIERHRALPGRRLNVRHGAGYRPVDRRRP